MRARRILFAAALAAALASAALPAAAAASDQPVASGATGHTFSGTSTNTVSWLGGGTTFECKGTEAQPETITTNGEFTTDETGTVEFLFHNCREKTLGTTCTSSGQPSGTIKTTKLPFHLVYLKPNETGEAHTHDTPGILITPNQEVTVNGKHWFAHFTCAGGFVKVTVGGNGILGDVTAPKIGQASNSMTIDVNATAAGQEHTTTHTEDIVYGLQAEANGSGETEPTYLNLGSNTVSFTEGFEATTTTETIEE